MSVFKSIIENEKNRKALLWAVIGLAAGLILSAGLYAPMEAGLGSGAENTLKLILWFVIAAGFIALGVNYYLKAENRDILYIVFLWLVYILFVGSLETVTARVLFLLYSLLAIPLVLFFEDRFTGKKSIVFFSTAAGGLFIVTLSKLPLLFTRGAFAFARAAYIYAIAVVIGYYLVHLIFVPRSAPAEEAG